jgi:hypothetical protein
MTLSRAWPLVVLLFLQSPAAGSAQSLVIPDRVQPLTRIRVEHLATIGTDPDGPLLSRLTTLAMDSEQFFLAAPTHERGIVAVFDRRGAFQGAFGREGRGPGEFAAPVQRVLVGPGDSIHVLEGPRHTVLLPRASGFARLRTLPFVPRDVGFAVDGRMIAAAPLPLRGDTTGLVHVLSPGGGIAQVLVHATRHDPRYPFESHRVVGSAAGDSLWIGHVRRYEIELWSARQGRLGGIRRDAPWFAEWSGESGLEWTSPRLAAVVQEGRYLWTLVTIPGAAARPQDTGESRPVSEIDLNEYFDTVIEVLDLRTARVVARRQVPGHLAGFLGGGPVVYARREGPQGEVLLDIYRLRLFR